MLLFQNDLQEFYSIVEFCNPGVLGKVLTQEALHVSPLTPPPPGSYGAFQKVYEQPIVRSQQPEATPPEREVGEMRAKEVRRVCRVHLLRNALFNCYSIHVVTVVHSSPVT